MRPSDVVYLNCNLARASGRTWQLCENIPDEPCMIVIHSSQMKNYILDMVRSLRPEYNIKNIQFIICTDGAEFLDKSDWRGKRFPVFFDHVVLELMSENYVKMVNNILCPGNERDK